MLDEKEIIVGCCRHDRKAQKALFERYASLLLGVCIRYSGRRDEAEDILQDGLIKMYFNIKDFAAKGALVNWMKKIMVNTAITHYHKTLKHQYHQDIEDIREMDIEGYGFDAADFTREELFGIIKELPDGYRMVFNLYAIDGYSHKEISEMLGISEGTSKSNLARARYILQEKVKQHFYSNNSYKDAK